MGLVTVGIGECKVSADKDVILKTYALGSCVGVIMIDRINFVGGMLHAALPEFDNIVQDTEKDKSRYVDTGIEFLIGRMKECGALIGAIEVYLYGGASVMDPRSFFQIGKKNVAQAKLILEGSGLRLIKEDTGGDVSRTISLNIGTGEITVQRNSLGS